MSITTFSATTVHPGRGTRVEISARQHRLVADEPLELGGTDQGANPVELLLGALGACQSVVAQVYAERFGVRYDELRIELEGDLDLDGFLDQGAVRPGFGEVRYRFVFRSDEPAEKFAPFFEFVRAHCPVGDTIEHAVRLTGLEAVVEAPLAA